MEHTDRTDGIAEIFQRLKNTAEPLGFLPIARRSGPPQRYRQIGSHTATARGKPTEPEVPHMHDRRLLADPTDHHRWVDKIDQAAKCVVFGWVFADDRILNR